MKKYFKLHEMNWENITKYSLFLLVPTIAFRIEFEVMGAVLTPTLLLTVFLLGITFLRYLTNPKGFHIRPIYLIPLLIFLLFAIPSRIPLLRIRGLAQGIWHLFRNLVELPPLIFLILVLNLKKREQIRVLIIILLIATTLSSVLGIVQTVSDGRYLTGIGVHGNLRYLGIFPPFPHDSQTLARQTIGKVTVITHTLGTDLFRAHGGLSSHNYFAAFLLLTLSISLSLALYKRSIFYSLLALLQCGGLAFTFTRAALIGCFFSVLILLFLRKDWIKDVVHLGLIAMILAISISAIRLDLMAGLINRTTHIFFDPKDAPVEVEARFSAWKTGVKGIQGTPYHLLFGHGTGGLQEFKILGIPLTSHNDVIDIIYSRGLIAFLGIAVLYALILGASFAVFKWERDSFYKGFGLGAFAGLIGLLLVGISQAIIQVEDTSTLVWFIFGLIVSLRETEKGASPDLRPGSR
jgi:hypothetical protein